MAISAAAMVLYCRSYTHVPGTTPGALLHLMVSSRGVRLELLSIGLALLMSGERIAARSDGKSILLNMAGVHKCSVIESSDDLPKRSRAAGTKGTYMTRNVA